MGPPLRVTAWAVFYAFCNSFQLSLVNVRSVSLKESHTPDETSVVPKFMDGSPSVHSMNLPLSRLLNSEVTPRSLRVIEAEYHLELTARNTGEIVAHQAELLGLQAQAAEMNLRAAGELARRQDETNELLSLGFRQVAEGINQLAEAVSDGLGELDATLSNGLQTVAAELRNISAQLWQQQQTLNQIVELLRQPYGTQARELLHEANKWLEQGVRRSGRDRDEDWKDAMGLLQEVISNRIGKQDYLAWFQIGWLHWKHKEDIGAAEEAFYQAQRLSAADQPAFSVKSLRHQAYMQDLLERFEDSYQTITKARQISEDHDTLYDAARYASKTGRKEESLQLIDRCIDLQPTTIITIFSEADFQ
jgi:tetratricopeptide (TPR) repeat protein